MTERKTVVSREHIFIFAPDEKGYEHIYAFLRSADFSQAYQEEDREGKFNIGLEAVLWILGQRLKGDFKPDLIFLETSLFPDRTRIDDRIVDFLSLQINDSKLDREEKDALLLDVYRQYKLVYTALHDTQNTVYYVPEFLREASEMRMVFSEYRAGATYSDMKEAEEKESIKLNKINDRIKQLVDEAAIKKAIKRRSNEDSKGWVDKGGDVYVTRDFLLSRESAEKREESTEDLELNAFIFHKLFHTKAFSQYKSSFLWCIPIVGAGERKLYGDQQKEHLAGQGALFVLLAYKKENIPLLEPEQQATDIARTVSYLLKDYFISYLYTSTREMVDQVVDRSLRMAVTAIMSRNMSHNIGSHVTPRTTVSAIEKRLDSFLLGQ